MTKAICSELPANSGKGARPILATRRSGGAQSTSPTEQSGEAGLRRAVTRHPHQSESRPLSSSERSEIIAKAHSGGFENKKRTPGLTPGQRKRQVYAQHGIKSEVGHFNEDLNPAEKSQAEGAWKDRKLSTRSDHAAAKRDRDYELREKGYNFLPPSTQRCGRTPVASGVAVNVYQDQKGQRRATYGHLHSCHSLSACPVCSAKIRAGRGVELNAEIAQHIKERGDGSVAMLSLTIRHRRGMSLSKLKDGLFEAWGGLNNRMHRESKARRGKTIWDLFGFLARVRTFEATYSSANAWNPHLHVVLMFNDSIHPSQQRVLSRYIEKLWQSKVTEALGSECRPTLSNGVDLKVFRGRHAAKGAADYLTKDQVEGLGWEMTDPGTKRAKAGSFKPFDLLEKAIGGCKKSAAVWREWVVTMKGARLLERSHKKVDGVDYFKGLRERAGIADKTDEQIIEESDRGVTVGQLDSETWKLMGKNRPLLRLEFLHQVEINGSSKAFHWLVKQGIFRPEGSIAEKATAFLESVPVPPPPRAA